MITEKDVNEAYDAMEKVFSELAKAEDKMSKTAEGLEDLKEGSKAALAIQERLKAMQPRMTELQRSYRLAGMQADRVRMLLDVEKNAKGRD